ncbi:hypothetical protein [Sphingobacterium yanglingense]|uniref:Uncharacterized protein n=1 Tax=Sphingobacterium yanglingense TaxID=1437280 RepID=A0A4R6WKV3_9SPHI|nr:hypothetical protein [Sphingobacterium yanglingense]TDQ79577.1 hypothetical protein CLV99_1022 [Sphingobacterium yanglingense]
MKTTDYIIYDHLGDNFESQNLTERKRRIDAQIEEYLRLYAMRDLSPKEDELVTNILLNLLDIQRAYSNRINLIKAIYLN